MVSRLAPVVFLCLTLLPAAACEDELEVRVRAYGLDAENIVFEVEDLGKPDRAELAELSKRGDIDGTALLSENECGGPCRAAIVTLLLRNEGSEPTAPPVVRFDSPPGRAGRVPIAFRGEEISPGRTGRIRFLITPYPDEKEIVATISGSVFVEVKQEAKTGTEAETETETETEAETETESETVPESESEAAPTQTRAPTKTPKPATATP